MYMYVQNMEVKFREAVCLYVCDKVLPPPIPSLSCGSPSLPFIYFRFLSGQYIILNFFFESILLCNLSLAVTQNPSFVYEYWDCSSAQADLA